MPLSTVENGQLFPCCEKIAALAQGLTIDAAERFSPPAMGTGQSCNVDRSMGHARLSAGEKVAPV